MSCVFQDENAAIIERDIGGAVGLCSYQSGSGSNGFRGWLNQVMLGSSSGIHSLIACQGGLALFSTSHDASCKAPQVVR